MVVTSFKCKLEKRTPKEVFYRDYKHFHADLFNNELSKELEKVVDWADFEDRTLKGNQQTCL